MKVRPSVTLTLVRQFNLYVFIILSLFSCPSFSKEKGKKSIIAEDYAIARYGRIVVFRSDLAVIKKNLLKLKCLEKNGLIFKFSGISLKNFQKELNYRKRSATLEELIILSKAISFSNDFNTVKAGSRIQKDLMSCSLPPYGQWSHSLKELVSFEIYLRDRFLSDNQNINNNFKKVLASFRSSVLQRDSHEWLIH